jgi:NADH dehydrogenase FAD-containing subunit
VSGPQSAPSGHVVLLGAGHANLLVVRAARRLIAAGLRVTLVDPEAFWYSGMAAAVAGGTVHPGRGRIDPAPLANNRGVECITDRVVGLGLRDRQVHLASGRTLDATAVVLNVGSEVDARGLPVDRADVTPVKPTRGLLELRDALATGPPTPRVVVVGGGASAIEVAGNLAAGPLARIVAPQLTVVAPGPLLPTVADDVRHRIMRSLGRSGVTVRTGLRAVDVTDAGVVLDDGSIIAADHTVLATGLRAARVLGDLGVTVPGDPTGGMPTTESLHHPDHPWLFGAGDAICFAGVGLPRLGVFAVRQAPVLVDNLLAMHTGTPLRAFEPQASFVTAVDLGGGDAVLIRGERWIAGRGALLAKRALDEWFLRRHRVPTGSSGRGWGRAVV